MTQTISQTRAAATPLGVIPVDVYRDRAHALRDAAIDAAFKTIAAKLNAVFARQMPSRELPFQNGAAAPCR